MNIKDLRLKLGRYWKHRILIAWETGNYKDLGIDSETQSELQRLRNLIGPSGLIDEKWK